MENDTSFCIVGIGSVRIWLYDCVFKTITDVKHIPNLSRSLLGFFNIGKLKCVVDGEKLKVTKGSLVV